MVMMQEKLDSPTENGTPVRYVAVFEPGVASNSTVAVPTGL